jgi:hypothetical protein
MSIIEPTPCSQLVAALRANIADPTNVTWRAVLEALKAVEAEDQHADRDAG